MKTVGTYVTREEAEAVRAEMMKRPATPYQDSVSLLHIKNHVGTRKSRLPFQANGFTFGGALSTAAEPKTSSTIIAKVEGKRESKNRPVATNFQFLKILAPLGQLLVGACLPQTLLGTSTANWN